MKTLEILFVVAVAFLVLYLPLYCIYHLKLPLLTSHNTEFDYNKGQFKTRNLIEEENSSNEYTK